MREPKVAIIDYEMCNLFSVTHACLNSGLTPVITRDPAVIDSADAVILPGVGAFGDAMKNLQEFNLIPVIERSLKNKPFMGICLGLQLLFSGSCEFGDNKGLNFVEGDVQKFPQEISGLKIKVPQIGWNRISFSTEESIFSGIPNESFFYFVHSYFVDPMDKEILLTSTIYENLEYCSSIKKNNVIAFQFHPEKSGMLGLKIYDNWKKIIQSRGVL